MTDNSELARGSRPKLDIVHADHAMWGVEGSGDTSGFDTFRRTVTIAPPAVRPYGSWYDEAVDILIELLTAEGLNPDEVIDTRWITLPDLRAEIARTPDIFTPWLRIYMADHSAMIFGPAA